MSAEHFLQLLHACGQRVGSRSDGRTCHLGGIPGSLRRLAYIMELGVMQLGVMELGVAPLGHALGFAGRRGRLDRSRRPVDTSTGSPHQHRQAQSRRCLRPSGPRRLDHERLERAQQRGIPWAVHCHDQLRLSSRTSFCQLVIQLRKGVSEIGVTSPGGGLVQVGSHHLDVADGSEHAAQPLKLVAQSPCPRASEQWSERRQAAA